MIRTGIPPNVPFDEARLQAAVELIGRSAANDLELGWTHDDGPRPGEWYATAGYKGAKVTVEHQHGPAEAAEALAFRLMEGGQCVHCGRFIVVPGYELKDGGDACRWTREGAHWLRGCDGRHGPPAGGLNREQRRRQDRALRLRR